MRALFDDWVIASTWLKSATPTEAQWTDEEYDARYKLLDTIEDRMDAAPLSDLHDLALKMAATSSVGEISYIGQDLSKDARDTMLQGGQRIVRVSGPAPVAAPEPAPC